MPQPDKNRILSYNGAMMAEGKEAERIVQDFFDTSSYVKEVKNVTGEKQYQEEDVDFVVKMHGGLVIKAEVKSDALMAEKRNFPFELERLNHRSKSSIKHGWTVYSKADLFFFWSKPSDELYIFTAKSVRTAFDQYILDIRNNQTVYQKRLKLIATDRERTTLIVLIPLSYIPFKVYSKIDSTWEMISENKLNIRKAA